MKEKNARFPFGTLSKTIPEPEEVSKRLGPSGCNNIMVLKHSPSLSLRSTRLRARVCSCASNPPPTRFQPETSRGVTRRISDLHSQIPNAGLQRARSGERWPPDEPRWGNPGTIPVKAAPEGRGCWSGAPLPHTPKKIHGVQRDEPERVYIYKGLRFRRTVYGSLSC